MVSISDISILKNSEKPKRVLKYFLLYITEGNIIIQVDDKEISLNKNDVLTITSGQYHYFKKINGEGKILDFTLDFFSKNDADVELIFQNGLFCHFDMNEVIKISNPKEIEHQLELIEKEISEKPFQYLISLHARIELVLIEINRQKIENGEEIWKPDALFLKFLETIRRNFDKNYTVAEVAKILNSTELKLNEQSKIHTGKTAQNVIYGLIISEAKRLLHYEKFSIKEVAYQLGFNDPFYFSNFFKKHTQLSPKDYKNQLT